MQIHSDEDDSPPNLNLRNTSSGSTLQPPPQYASPPQEAHTRDMTKYFTVRTTNLFKRDRTKRVESRDEARLLGGLTYDSKSPQGGQVAERLNSRREPDATEIQDPMKKPFLVCCLTVWRLGLSNIATAISLQTTQHAEISEAHHQIKSHSTEH